MEETPEYMKGQAAALKLLNRVLFGLLVSMTTHSTTGELDARFQLANEIGKLAREFKVAEVSPLFNKGFHNALTEFSAKPLS